MEAKMNSTVEYLNLDDVRLALHSWLPKQPQALLFLIPGMQSRAVWFDEAGEYLASKNIALFILDRRGVALSDGKQGDILSAKILLSDYIHALHIVRNRYRKLPLTLFGQSLGGSMLAAMLSLNDFNVNYNAAVFCAAGLGRRHRQLSTTEYGQLLLDKSETIFQFDLPVNDMTDQQNFQQFIERDQKCCKTMTHRARASLLEIENLYWNQKGVIKSNSAFIYPKVDPIVNTQEAIKVFNKLSANKGIAIEFPTIKHFIWFTTCRHMLLQWLSHYVLTGGYK